MLNKLIITGAALFVAVPAAAAPIASSAASDLAVDIAIAQVVNAGVGPLSSASGSTASGDYTSADAVARVDASLDLLSAGLIESRLDLGTGINSVTASGQASGPSASASALVNGLSFSFTNSLLGIDLPSLLTVSASTISSNSSASGAGGLLSASGDSTIEDLSLSGALLAGIDIDLGAVIDGAANAVLLDSDILGLRITANEQIELGDGVTSTGIETNALRITLSDFLLNGGLLNGDIYIGRSRAFAELGEAAADVPAPGAIGLFGLGMLGIAGWRRRRRTAAA